MTERKILSSLRLNLVIFALAALAATNVFFNFLNPAQDSVDLQNYLLYDNISTMFVGFSAFLLFIAEVVALTRNKGVGKFFTFLKFVSTVGAMVTLIYSYAVYLPMNYEDVSTLDYVLAYNGALFTRTLVPLLACYSLVFADSYNKLKVPAFFFGPLLPLGYGAYTVVNQLFFDGEVSIEYFDYVNADNRTTTIISTAAVFAGALVLSLILVLLMRLNSRELREVNDTKVKPVKEKKTKKDSLNFATLEDNEENHTEPFEFGEGRKPEKQEGMDYTKSSLTDILGETKEESPELSKEISFSLEDKPEEGKKELSSLEKLSLSLDEQKHQEKKVEEVKENKVAQPPIKVVPVTTPKTTTIPLVKEEKKETDFKAEKQVKNENPLSVKMPTPKKSSPTPAPASDDKENRVYHVGKQKSGKWQVKLANGEKAIRVFDTQKEAIDCAKELIKTQGGSYRIHSRQGKIRK